MSAPFRAKLVLMILGEYACGDHVADDRAFAMRCRNIKQLRSRQVVEFMEADFIMAMKPKFI